MARTTLPSLIPRFVDFLSTQLDLSPATAAAYQADLKAVFRTLGEELHRQPRPSDITHAWLQEHLSSLVRAGRNPATVVRKLAAVRCLFRFLRRARLVGEKDVCADILIPRRRRKMPKFLSQEDAERLVEQPLAAGRTPMHLRDHALLSVLYEGGLRASEPGAIRLDELMWDCPERGVLLLRIMGKGRKERFVPVRRAARALTRYLKVRDQIHPEASKQPYLFVSASGGPITRFVVKNVVEQAARLTCIKAHPHLLRHTCATLMLLHGAELRAVQDLLGHSEPATTARYAHTTVEHLLRRGLDHHPGSDAPPAPPPAPPPKERDETKRIELHLERFVRGAPALDPQEPGHGRRRPRA